MWITRASAVGLAASLFIHVFGSIILGSVIVGQRGSPDAVGDLGQALEVAPVPSETLADPGPPAESTSTPTSSALSAALLESPALEIAPQPLALTPTQTTTTSLTGLTGEFSGATATAGASGASFFGIEARGTRFAYVVDTSGSMVNDRIVRLREELRHSIFGLSDDADFFVVRYSTDASPLGDQQRWIDANDGGKRWADRHIPDLVAEGQTNPVAGFRLVEVIKPRPDVIFFMTDAQDMGNVIDDILAIQRRVGAEIHCITFGTNAGAAIMQRIADASGGKYRHVP